MFFERFIAQRFLPKDRNSFSAPLVKIATYSIALGVLVMVASVCILRGFQGEIRQKVVGFGSHIVVKNYSTNNNFEESPIDMTRPEVERIRSTEGVRHVEFFATKGGMVKTEEQIQGIILKGLDKDYDSSFFAANLVEGRLPYLADQKPSNEIIISQTIADKLHLELGDKVRTYFWQGETYRARAFEISGVYNTDLSDFDNHFIVGDLRQVQKLNNWDSNMVGGYEVLVDNFSHIDAIMSQNDTIETYRLEGRAAGIAEGRAVGIVEGEAIGLKRGEAIGLKKGEEKKAIEIAKSLKNQGVNNMIISKASGLTVDEIEKL